MLSRQENLRCYIINLGTEKQRTIPSQVCLANDVQHIGALSFDVVSLCADRITQSR